MRTTIIALATALAAMTVTGCKEKKDNGDIITQKVVKKKTTSPISMQRYSQKKDIEWAGTTLTFEITREPDESLPKVKDESGQQHVDNRITLKIRRADGTTFVEKTFTKASFDAYIDNDYRKNGVLEGIVFDKVDGNSLRLAASVSHPQTDEYIPMVVILSPTGGMTIARDTQLDTSGEEEEN